MKKDGQRQECLSSISITPEFLRFIKHYRNLFDERYQRYLDEEFGSFVRSEGEKRALLTQQFAQHGITFEEEIFPLFSDTYYDFVQLWAVRRAITETAKDLRTRLRRYRLSVNLVVEDEAPFPSHLKEALVKQWAAFDQFDFESLMLRFVRKAWGDKTHLVSGTKLAKVFHKHPAWMNLERTLYETLTVKKGLSQRQTLHLIALLLKTLLPHGVDAAHLEDTIRLRVTV